MSSKNKRIGFVGVGRMGANMARHLNDEGYKITAVYDKHRPAAAALAEELGPQTTAFTVLADVTENSDIIFTVVTDDAAMHRIFHRKSANLLSRDANGRLFINCATLYPQAHKDAARAAARNGADTLEACMASSISQARTGKLYLMVAGEEKIYKRTDDLIKSLSIKSMFVGGPGKAAEVKSLVNMVMNNNTAGLAEGLGLAKALKLDLKQVCQVFAETGANSRVLESDAADMIAREHDCWFSAEHAAKDSGIAAKLAHKKKLSLPLNDATKAQYDRMTREGLGGLDKSGIAELTFPGRGPKKKRTAKKKH